MEIKEMTIGNRTYEILDFLREGETWVVGSTMVERAKEMSAHLGEEDGRYLLDHQKDILDELWRDVAFVFTDWRDPDDPDRVFYVCQDWDDDVWFNHWEWLGGHWYNHYRVLRRK